MAPVVTTKQLLEAGVHFGHQTRRWNPKMKRFLFGERNGIYIIDLEQTLERTRVAYEFVRDLVADGGTMLFVGTKKQAQDSIQSYAEKCNMPYVNERWLGGMLTNFETISKRVSKMQEYQRMRDSGEFEEMPKKEALLLGRELVKLEHRLKTRESLERKLRKIRVEMPELSLDEIYINDAVRYTLVVEDEPPGHHVATIRTVIAALEAEGHEHRIEKVGSGLRAMMPWISEGKESVQDASGGQG